MREVLGAAITFITIAVVVMIGGAMISVTQNVTTGIAGNSSFITTLATNTGNALTTLTSLLPILALAIIGGLSIFYLLGFLGRGMA